MKMQDLGHLSRISCEILCEKTTRNSFHDWNTNVDNSSDTRKFLTLLSNGCRPMNGKNSLNGIEKSNSKDLEKN